MKHNVVISEGYGTVLEDKSRDGELRISNHENPKQSFITSNGNTLDMLNRLPFWYRCKVAFRLVLGMF